jgi:hypothetical protein
MANSLAGPVWKVDTAATLVAGPVRVSRFRWVGATTAGHTCVVTDTAGHVVFSSVATAANFAEDKALDVPLVNGLIVTTIASGILYIEFA